MSVLSVQALLFDVQGTATDFHSTIRRAAADALGGERPGEDWSAFVNEWRAAYFAETSQQPEQGPWMSVASVYRKTLDPLLDARGISAGVAARDELARAWARLDPWPDTVAGLRRLRTRFTLATLSNADVSAVVAIRGTGTCRGMPFSRPRWPGCSSPTRGPIVSRRDIWAWNRRRS